MGSLRSNYSTEDFREITPHDSTDLATQPRAIMSGDGGLVQCVRPDGTVVPMRLQSGRLYPVSPVRINATGTTATEIVGLW